MATKVRVRVGAKKTVDLNGSVSTTRPRTRCWCAGPGKGSKSPTVVSKNRGSRPLDSESGGELGDEFSDILGVTALRRATHNRTPNDNTVRTCGRNRSDMSSRRYTEAHTEWEG